MNNSSWARQSFAMTLSSTLLRGARLTGHKSKPNTAEESTNTKETWSLQVDAIPVNNRWIEADLSHICSSISLESVRDNMCPVNAVSHKREKSTFLLEFEKKKYLLSYQHFSPRQTCTEKQSLIFSVVSSRQKGLNGEQIETWKKTVVISNVSGV